MIYFKKPEILMIAKIPEFLNKLIFLTIFLHPLAEK